MYVPKVGNWYVYLIAPSASVASEIAACDTEVNLETVLAAVGVLATNVWPPTITPLPSLAFKIAKFFLPGSDVCSCNIETQSTPQASVVPFAGVTPGVPGLL